jgi:hypothetical protein
LIDSSSIISQNIDYYQNKLKNVTILLDGKELKHLGLKSGPMFKLILQKTFESKIDGNLKTLQDEIEFAKKIINKEV